MPFGRGFIAGFRKRCPLVCADALGCPNSQRGSGLGGAAAGAPETKVVVSFAY